MKEFFRVMMRYLPPYKKFLYLNMGFNFLSAFFGVFSIITIIPLLKILFGLEEKTYGYISIKSTIGNFSDFQDALIHNVYSFITSISESKGGTMALIYIGVFMIFMVFLKVGFTYLANYNIVHLRNSVVRDIRNQIFNKTV